MRRMAPSEIAAVLLTGAALGVAVAAQAAETITYSYDARGRVIAVNRTGTVNNNVVTNYAIDKADNRTNKTTTGSPNPPPP
jgi:YD repeat-containing protein